MLVLSGLFEFLRKEYFPSSVSSDLLVSVNPEMGDKVLIQVSLKQKPRSGSDLEASVTAGFLHIKRSTRSLGEFLCTRFPFINQHILMYYCLCKECRNANQVAFSSSSASHPASDAVTEAGGVAYAYGPKHALAQLAVTGTFNSTYYVSGKDQLDRVIELGNGLKDDPVFIGKVAIYSRQHAYMKDMPVALRTQRSGFESLMIRRASWRASKPPACWSSAILDWFLVNRNGHSRRHPIYCPLQLQTRKYANKVALCWHLD